MMAIQFTFYRVSEKKPKHNEEIIWLKSTSVLHTMDLSQKKLQLNTVGLKLMKLVYLQVTNVVILKKMVKI